MDRIKKHMKSKLFLFGLMYGLLLIFSDSSFVIESRFGKGNFIVRDLMLYLSFAIISTLAVVKIINFEETNNKFKKGYITSLKVGIIGILVYVVIGLILGGFKNEYNMGFLGSVLNNIPNYIAESVFKLFFTLIFSVLPAIYFSIRYKNNHSNILDENF